MSTRYKKNESSDEPPKDEPSKKVLDRVLVRLDDGGKIDFKREDRWFRITLITPKGAELPAALITAERLHKIGEALVILATAQAPPETPPMATESEGDSRFSLLEVDD